MNPANRPRFPFLACGFRQSGATQASTLSVRGLRHDLQRAGAEQNLDLIERKQIAEIDARVAPIFHVVDAFIDNFVAGATSDDASHFRESVYREIYNFCEVVIEQSGKLNPRNDYLLRILSGKPGVNVDKNHIVDQTSIDRISIGFESNKKSVKEYLIAAGDKHNPVFLTIYSKYSNVYVELANFIVDEPGIDPLVKRDLIDNLKAKFEPFRVTDHRAQQPNAAADDGTSGAAKTLDISLTELDGLIGLDSVKREVRLLVNLMRVRELRRERGLPSPEVTLHLVFTGNPGTGKTTVARLFAEICRALGVLTRGHLVEVDRAGLVGGYVGQTALKTQQVIDSAMNGVLFIDEAYSLTRSNSDNDYGMESLATGHLMAAVVNCEHGLHASTHLLLRRQHGQRHGRRCVPRVGWPNLRRSTPQRSRLS